MARDIPDKNLRYVLLGRVNEVGKGGFEIRSFLTDHFIKGSQYIEDLFAIPCVHLDPKPILERLSQ